MMKSAERLLQQAQPGSKEILSVSKWDIRSFNTTLPNINPMKRATEVKNVEWLH